MKIISKEKSKLIDRTELLIECPHVQKPTPSNSEIKKEIAKELKTKEELIAIKTIKTKYGEGNSLISAFAYDNLEEFKKLEKYEEPKKEEAPAEAPKEEKPIEEVKKEESKENGEETKTEEQDSK